MEKAFKERVMALQPEKLVTAEKYLALERKADHKSEYYAGEIFAMAGASERHNLIVANVVAELRAGLKRRDCKVYPSDMRLKILSTGLYTYPDVVVVCNKPQFDDEHKDTLLNPTLIVEILSESTEAYDRGKKFEHYRKIESLAKYLLIPQDSPKIEYYSRQPENQWLLSEITGLQNTVKLAAIGCELVLAEVYDKVEI